MCPEYYTMWNYRRKILLNRRKTLYVENDIAFHFTIFPTALIHFATHENFADQRKPTNPSASRNSNWPTKPSKPTPNPTGSGTTAAGCSRTCRSRHGRGSSSYWAGCWTWMRGTVSFWEGKPRSTLWRVLTCWLVVVHGWGHRRYVIAASHARTPLEEFNYTSEKIAQNFSNYSAWHYRSKVLLVAFDDEKEREGVLDKGARKQTAYT